MAPDRMARKMLTRASDSVYVSDRVASRLQCSVARICSLVAAPGSGLDGGISVDISCTRRRARRDCNTAPRSGMNATLVALPDDFSAAEYARRYAAIARLCEA